jgi:hypothetical protein
MPPRAVLDRRADDIEDPARTALAHAEPVLQPPNRQTACSGRFTICAAPPLEHLVVEREVGDERLQPPILVLARCNGSRHTRQVYSDSNDARAAARTLEKETRRKSSIRQSLLVATCLVATVGESNRVRGGDTMKKSLVFLPFLVALFALPAVAAAPS